MNKRIASVILIFVLLSVFTLPIHADTGPKPSVKISFTNVTDTEFYVTLLSKHDSTGPWSSAEKYDMYSEYDGYFPREIYDKFVSYEDSDGFHFLQYGAKYDGESFEWNYYPPTVFKPLLYFPATDTFIVGEIYERYAFDSYYTLDVGAAFGSGAVLTESYDYTAEAVSLTARIIITFAAELLLALLAFGYRGKKLYLMLAAVNFVTQIALNVTVNIKGFFGGPYDYIATFIVIEIFIFIAESLIYRYLIPRLSEKSARRGVAVCYALSANTLSLILGLYLSSIIPQIF